MSVRFLSGEAPKAFEISSDTLEGALGEIRDLVKIYTEGGVEPVILAINFDAVYDGLVFREHSVTVVFSGAYDDKVGDL